MHLAEQKTDFGAWLRRAWNKIMTVADAIERSPIEDVFYRLDRLERGMTALKCRKPAGIDDAM